MGFAAAIRAGRLAKGLSQEALADRLGVKQTAVSKWEAGKALPSVPLFDPLATMLDLDLADLLRLAAAAGSDDSPPTAGVRPEAAGSSPSPSSESTGTTGTETDSTARRSTAAPHRPAVAALSP